MQKDKIFDLVRFNIYAVVSTINKASQPESALVGISHNSKHELIFATSSNTRKVENIRNNPNVSLVIGGSDGSLQSVQIEGVARVLNHKDAKNYAETHYQKIPSAREHQFTPGECFVVVTPLWARYTSYLSPIPEVFVEHFSAD